MQTIILVATAYLRVELCEEQVSVHTRPSPALCVTRIVTQPSLTFHSKLMQMLQSDWLRYSYTIKPF